MPFSSHAQPFQDTDYEVIAVPHRQLHLDCCLNPLGLEHLLIHPDSLLVDDEQVWQVLKQREWVEIDTVEREHMATNVLSIQPNIFSKFQNAIDTSVFQFNKSIPCLILICLNQ